MKGFERYKQKIDGTPFAVIMQRFTIYFSSKLIRKYNLMDYKNAGLFCNLNQRLIGIKFLKNPDEFSYKVVSLNKTTDSSEIHARAFGNYYRLKLDYPSRHRCTYNNLENMITIDLNNKLERVKKNEMVS